MRPLVAIVGAPNAGKSTLFNRLVGRGPGLAAFRPRALVSPLAGTTRDRLESSVDWEGTRFHLVDTGGVHGLDVALAGAISAAAATARGTAAPPPVERLVEGQVLEAVAGASVVLFMVDALAGVTPSDERLTPLMRQLASRAGPPSVILVANKLDHDQASASVGFMGELWSLGLGEPLALSAYHGRGVDKLLARVAAELPPAAFDAANDEQPPAPDEHTLFLASRQLAGEVDCSVDAEYADEYEDEEAFGMNDVDSLPLVAESAGAFFGGLGKELKLAVVGRPNVGKSSLVNRLLGAPRMVVHHEAGTTRDAVSAPLEWHGSRLLVADTAGIRRPQAGGVHREELDRMAVAKARQMIMSCHAALLVYDAAEGLVRADMQARFQAAASCPVFHAPPLVQHGLRAFTQVADLIVEHGKSCVLLANKIDLLSDKERKALQANLASRLPMLASYSPLVLGSALHGEGIEEAMDLVAEAARWRSTRVPRRRLNDLFRRAQLLRPLPMVRAKTAAQAGRLRVLYVLQAFTEAPTFVFHLNRHADLHPSDERWLVNTIRSQWAFAGTPIRIVLRVRDSRRRRRDREGGTRRERNTTKRRRPV